MRTLTTLVVAAGWLQLSMAALNFALPKLFNYRENLPRLSPIVRQIFVVHSVYIFLVLVIFGLLCVLYPVEMISGQPMARFLNLSLAIFWLLRLGIQLLYYDAETLSHHPKAAAALTLSVVYLASIFGFLATAGFSG